MTSAHEPEEGTTDGIVLDWEVHIIFVDRSCWRRVDYLDEFMTRMCVFREIVARFEEGAINRPETGSVRRIDRKTW